MKAVVREQVEFNCIQFETNNDDGRHLDMLKKWVENHGGLATHDNTDLYVGTINDNISTLCQVTDWLLFDGYRVHCMTNALFGRIMKRVGE